MKTYFKFILSGLVIVLLCFSWAYWDNPIEREDNCIEFNLNSDEFKKIKVRINGVISRSLLRKDVGRLNIIIGDKIIPDFEKHPHVLPLNFKERVGIQDGNDFKSVNAMEQTIFETEKYYEISLNYDYFDEESLGSKRETIGILYFDKKFNKMFIIVYEEREDETGYFWSGEDGKVIVPESNIKDAKKLIENMTKWNIGV